MHAARNTCAARQLTAGVHSRRRPGRRSSGTQDIGDRLVEDARTFLVIIDRQQTSYDGALDGLVRDAFGSADRLRAAAAAARASGRPAAEVDLLDRAAERAQRTPPPRVPQSPPRPDARPFGGAAAVGRRAHKLHDGGSAGA